MVGPRRVVPASPSSREREREREREARFNKDERSYVVANLINSRQRMALMMRNSRSTRASSAFEGKMDAAIRRLVDTSVSKEIHDGFVRAVISLPVLYGIVKRF